MRLRKLNTGLGDAHKAFVGSQYSCLILGNAFPERFPFTIILLARETLNIMVHTYSLYLGKSALIVVTQLTLLASVEAAALAVPGIETAHWLTRSFWLGGTALAVCGVLTGAMIPGAFHIFFGEDMEQNSPQHRSLTLDTNAALVHEIDGLFSLPTLVCLSSCPTQIEIILADFFLLQQGDYVVRWPFHGRRCRICCNGHF